MTETTRNTAVGLFVIMSFVILGTLMAWFGETPEWLGVNEWTLEIVGTRELRGIAPGSPVQLNGVEIGRVKDLSFVNTARPDRGVIVVARIKEKYSIPQGATARLYGATLGFGSGRVDIIVEAGVERPMLPRENAQIVGEMRSIIGEFINKEMVDSFQQTFVNIGNLAKEATPAAQNLAKLLETRPVAEVSRPGSEVSPNISTVVERLDTLLANLDSLVGDPGMRGEFHGAVSDIKSATQQLRHTVEIWKTQSQVLSENLNIGIEQTRGDLDRNFDKLYLVLDNLDNSTQALNFSLAQIAQGRGTLGMLAHDPRLYEAAVISVQRFGESMATLNAILAKIEREGFITVDPFPPSGGLIKRDVPLRGTRPPR